jgi:hypothetical protein
MCGRNRGRHQDDPSEARINAPAHASQRLVDECIGEGDLRKREKLRVPIVGVLGEPGDQFLGLEQVREVVCSSKDRCWVVCTCGACACGPLIASDRHQTSCAALVHMRANGEGKGRWAAGRAAGVAGVKGVAGEGLYVHTVQCHEQSKRKGGERGGKGGQRKVEGSGTPEL